jgi:two-component sensor histidine kinase
MVWCSTNKGLVRIDPNSKGIQLYARHHGLQNSEYDFGVSHKDSMGRLYFGGTKGYYRFRPNELKERDQKPTVRLTNVALPNSSKLSQLQLSQPTPLQLTHKDYFITFTFSVLDFLDPDRNQFRYMLEGFDPEWIDNGTRNTATYTNLPAGDYVFRVQGANSAGVWNREGLAIDVRVLPPPWFSWWAYCLYSIVSVFVFWLLRRAYDSYAIEKRAVQIAIEKHETENRADDDMQEQLEMQDDLVKSVYRHNVATLALISDYISRQGAVGGTADESIKRVSALAALEECRYYQNDGLLADLHKYTDIMISRLIKDATVPPESIISINEVTTKLVSAELASPLSIVIYELLENSFQHAFEAGSQANYVQVTLGIESTDSPVNSQYRLTISDSGTGCPRNIRPDAPETPGFATVSAITEMLSGNLHISSENGTSVTLVFPAA